MKKTKIVSFIVVISILLNLFIIYGYSASEEISLSEFQKKLCGFIEEYDKPQLSSDDNEFFANRLVVKTSTNESLTNTYGAVGVIEGYKGIHILQYESPLEVYSAYNQIIFDDIEYVEKNFYVELDSIVDDTSSTSSHLSWNSDVAQVDEAFTLLNKKNIATTEIKVAVIDSGIFYNHEYFDTSRIINSGFCAYRLLLVFQKIF